MVQLPTYQTMLMDESVMQKYNISIIESNWLAIVGISSGSHSQHMIAQRGPCVLPKSGMPKMEATN